MSWFSELFRKQAGDCTTGFLVFDYKSMEVYYGQQAFEAIYAASRSTAGICAFFDGDVLTTNPGETVRDIAQHSSQIRPAHQNSPLVDLKGPFDFGAYLVGLWTDTYSNFKKISNVLAAGNVPGYLGCIVMSGKHEYGDAVKLFTTQLKLPANLALKDGSIIKGTTKFGYGISE